MLFQTTNHTKRNWQKILLSLFLVLVFCATTVLPVFAHSFEAQAATTSVPQEMYVWGLNDRGQTGLGIDRGNVLTPARLRVNADWKEMSAGPQHSLAINSAGELYAWGENTNGKTGLGTDVGNTLVPTRVGTASNWIQVSAGPQHSLALNDLGEMYSWGINARGETGLGTDVGNTLVPTRVGTASDWTQISAASMFSQAINSAGELYAWGSNTNGRTGFGVTSGTTLLPTRVGTASNWVSLASTVHSRMTFAINTSGELYAWGHNVDGATGLGLSTGNTTVPTRVGTASNWTQVAAGYFHGLAINSAGELYSWGRNDHGRTGLGTEEGGTLTPVRVGTASNWTGVACGTSSSYAINSLGELYSWGDNFRGATGQGISGGNTLLPAQIGKDVMWSKLSVSTEFVMAFGIPVPPVPLTPGTLNKTLQMPEGTPLDVDPSFSFSFVASERDGTRPIAEVPAITPNPTITLDRTTAVTESGITTILGSLDLTRLLEDLSFPRAGYYAWEVSEVADSSGLHTPPREHMSYDDSTYVLTVLVDRFGNIETITVQEKLSDDTLGSKEDHINFRNTFVVIADDGLLEISKDVVGQFADTTLDFSFDLELISNPLYPLPSSITAKVLDRTGAEIREVTITDRSATFTLKHGERLAVEGLPVGTSYKVTERAIDEFAPAVSVTAGGVAVQTDSAGVNSELATDIHLIADGGANTVEFTNTHFFSPLTGLVIADNTAIMLAIGLVLMFVMLVASRRRKRIEELPIV